MPSLSYAQKTARNAAASQGTSSNRIYRAVLEIIARHGLGGNVLDFGAGTGAFSRILLNQQEVRSVTAVDIVEYPGIADQRVAWLKRDLNLPVPVPDASFDLIVALGVIEYLENPNAVARDWFRLIKEGGALVLSTPNNESWRSLISLVLRGQFVAFTNPKNPNLTALVRDDLQRKLSAAGFSRTSFEFTNYGSVPKFTNLTWQRLSAGLLRGLRFSDDLLAIAWK